MQNQIIQEDRQELLKDGGSSEFEAIKTMASNHFWFCCYPGFNTQLVFYPRVNKPLEGLNRIDLYDSDGALINTAQVSFTGESFGVFDIDCLVSECKLESGLKHGHIVVSTANNIGCECRLLTLKSGWVLNKPQSISKRLDSFSPVLFSPDRSTYVALVNHSDEDALIRIRVFCGSRTPKIERAIPAKGARIFSLDTLFPEYGYLDGKTLNAYIRVSVKEGNLASAIVMERFLDRADSDYFQIVC